MKICFLILGSVLICSALAYDWEGSDNEDNSLEALSAAHVPGMCKVCKLVLNKVKKSISNGTTPDEIHEKLRAACLKIGILKSACKGFVKRYMKELVEELSTTDDVRTICVRLKACEPKEQIYL